jgi:hypothetical protein
MMKRSLWSVAVLAAALLAFAWAGAPSTRGSAGDGTGALARTQVQTQVQTQMHEQAAVRTRTEASRTANDEATLLNAAPAGDVKHDRIHLRLQDGSCLDEATLDSLSADLLRTRDRLNDGSCLPDGACVDHDYAYDHGFDYDFDYGYDYLRDGPPEDGGYGPGSS